MQNIIKINQDDFKKVAKKLRTEITPLLINPIKHSDALELFAKITNYGTYYNYNKFINSIPVDDKKEIVTVLNTDNFTDNLKIESMSNSINMENLLICKFEYLHLTDLVDEVKDIKHKYQSIFTVEINLSYDGISNIMPGLYLFKYPNFLEHSFNTEQIKILLVKNIYEYFLKDCEFVQPDVGQPHPTQPQNFGVRENKVKSDSCFDFEIDNLGDKELHIWIMDENKITYFLPKNLEQNWILHQDSIDKVYERIQKVFNTEEANRFIMFSIEKR